MAIDPTRQGMVFDPRGMESLRAGARAQTPEAMREVARQFESLFAQMLIKSMRDASMGGGIDESEQTGFYRDMFDQQLGVELTKGRGLGLAEMLMRQLSGGAAAEAAPGAAEAAAPAAVPGSQPANPAAPTGAAAGAAEKSSPAVGATPAATTSATGEGAHWPPKSRADFIRALWPHAEAAGRKLGVDPATIVSHAALESAWGRSQPATVDGRPSFNLFGIKAGRSWNGAAAPSSTIEFEGGLPTRRVERFRAYASLGEGIMDYARMLAGSARYAAAINTGTDVHGFAGALQKGGYATDPHYASKLQAVAGTVRNLMQGDPLKFVANQPIHAQTKVNT